MATPGGAVRILLAWELGGGQGHIRSLLPVAERLRALGADVVFAVRDLAPATVLTKAGFAVHLSPRIIGDFGFTADAYNYAEVMMRGGYDSTANVALIAACWKTLLHRVRPDVVVADFAPGALLGARVAGIKAASLGNGFFLPPLVTPLPTIRPWQRPLTERMAQSERDLLGWLNAALANHGAAPLKMAAEIAHTGCDLLAIFPELDQYENRQGGEFIGTIFSSPPQAKVSWPNAPGPRTFAYLSGANPHFPAIAMQMRALGSPVFAVARGLNAQQARAMCSPTLTVSEMLVSVDDALRMARLVICHATTGLMSQSLLAGIPVLGLPQQAEQGLSGENLKRHGYGLSLAENAPAPHITNAARHILSTPSFARAAQSFAERHRNFRVERAIETAARRILARAGG